MIESLSLMKLRRSDLLCALVAAFASLPAAATDVALAGVFPGKALLLINQGAPRALAVGVTTPEGVRILAVDDSSATLEVDGKRRRLVADFIAAGGHALEVVNGLQPAEQVGGLAILAREFGMLASVGSDFHAPGDWSELGMYRPLPEDLSPLWERFDHARATTA